MRLANYKLPTSWAQALKADTYDAVNVLQQSNEIMVRTNRRTREAIAKHGLDSPDLPPYAFREIAEPEPVNHAAIALQAKMERQATHAYVKARMAGRFNTDSYDKHCEEQEIVRGFMALEEGA